MPSSCHSSVKHCRLGWKPASRPGMTGFVIRVAPSVSSQCPDTWMALLHRYL
ncbi:hypothetical protein [Wolbachia endosymbiont (group A) of Oxytorus armatus]|uniref:hypothetical protein n=1 Tax=Wolbachia endosymbiont (group A) of Oxytorus armatus TaxID=3066211 RepID=UPI003132BD62